MIVYNVFITVVSTLSVVLMGVASGWYIANQIIRIKRRKRNKELRDAKKQHRNH